MSCLLQLALSTSQSTAKHFNSLDRLTTTRSVSPILTRIYANNYQNWGDRPFSSAVNSWYWGHAKLGPYYLVFFDALTTENVESVSGYVIDSRTGEPAGTTCSELVVRPIDAPYPPGLLKPNPESYSIYMDMGDGAELNATVTRGATQIDVGAYARWIGGVEGTVGGEEYEGSALWEQFKLKI
jgi:hypothetical protein